MSFTYRERVNAILDANDRSRDMDLCGAICGLIQDACEEQKEVSAALLEKAAHALHVAGSVVPDASDIKQMAAVIEAMAITVRRGTLEASDE